MPTWYIYILLVLAHLLYNIKKTFKENLRYTTRWMIFVNAFGLGTILVCGETIAKLVCVSLAATGFNSVQI
jgi:hypothetical protein